MNIYITGDSWGLGEWSNAKISHHGLHQYFIDAEHSVTNMSLGGNSNISAITGLELVFKLKREYDYIFWFQTDPLRDLRFPLEELKFFGDSPRKYEYFKQDSITYTDLVNKQDELLELTYERLNNLGQSIHCIGGCSKLNLSLISKFNNLVPIVPSVIELVLPNYELPVIWHSDWLSSIDRQFDLSSLDKLLIDKRKQDGLYEEKTYFWPDGHHLNRLGHKLLFDYICRYLKV